MRQSGKSSQEIAARLVYQRNSQKVWARDSMSSEEVASLDMGNVRLYGDPVGPTPMQMLEKYMDWDKVISKSVQKDPAINMLLGIKK